MDKGELGGQGFDISDFKNETGNTPSPETSTPYAEFSFEEAGLNADHVRHEIMNRLKRLKDTSDFFEDEMNSRKLADYLFSFYESEHPERSFSEEDRKIVHAGTLFSDIGKTGPLNADEEQQKIILDIFNVNNWRDPSAPLENFMRECFPSDYEERLAACEKLGISRSLPMRDVWNMHCKWTYDIIAGDGVPKEDVAAAATHHILENVNSELVAPDGTFAKDFGKNTRFDRPEKLIILLDKYDAYRGRSGLSHEEAMRALRARLASSAYAEDPEFLTLIDDMDAAFKSKDLSK